MIQIKFDQVKGEKVSQRDNFEELVTQLVLKEYLGAKPIEGKGGDEGVDTFVGVFNGSIICFQSKYFLDTLTPTQKREIKDSLKIAHQKHHLKIWILCIPKNFTPAEERWFESLKTEYPDVDIDAWQGSHLKSLLLKDKNNGVLFYYFGKKQIGIDLFRRQTESQLSRLKNSNKYIPDVFVETGQLKENLRYFANPLLFISFITEKIDAISFRRLNRYLKQIPSLYPYVSDTKKFVNDKPPAEIANIYDLERYVQILIPKIKAEIKTIEKITRYKEGRDTKYPELRYGQFLKLKNQGWALERKFKSILNDFKCLISKVSLIIDSAGRGKTNFVCDFSENFINKQNFISLFFSGGQVKVKDEFEIESYILNSLDLADSYGFSEFLSVIQQICETKREVFTFIIDGLNENSDINNFSQALEHFIEKVVSYNNIRCILICRSEFFSERFGNLNKSIFADRIYFIDREINSLRSQFEKNKLFYGYLNYFRIDQNNIFNQAKEKLSNDPLLLRFFCEAYGDPVSPERIKLPTIDDIYREDIFRIYYERKVEGIICSWKDGEIVCTVNKGKRNAAKILDSVIGYMIDNKMFVDIPFEVLDEIAEDQMIFSFLDEDILLRKDIDEHGKEVVNFTFDEFRDYLISKKLVKIYNEEPQNAKNIINFLLKKRNPVSEGVAKYLFLIQKKNVKLDIRAILGDELYEVLFKNFIFSVPPENITDSDVESVRNLLIDKKRQSHDVISHLAYNWKIDHYTKLNICLFLDTALEMSSYLLDYKFQTLIYKKSRYTNGLFEFCENALEKHNFKTDQTNVDYVFQLLILIFGNINKTYRIKSANIFKEYLIKRPERATEALIKYLKIDDLYIREIICGFIYLISSIKPEALVRYKKEILAIIDGRNFKGYHIIIRDYIKGSLQNLNKFDSELFSQYEIKKINQINKPTSIKPRKESSPARPTDKWTGWTNGPIGYDMKKLYFSGLAHHFGLHRCDATDEAIKVLVSLGYEQEKYKKFEPDEYEYRFRRSPYMREGYGDKYVWQAHRIVQGKWISGKPFFIYDFYAEDEKPENQVLDFLERDFDPFFQGIKKGEKPSNINLINISNNQTEKWINESRYLKLDEYIIRDYQKREFIVVKGYMSEIQKGESIRSYINIDSDLIYRPSIVSLNALIEYEKNSGIYSEKNNYCRRLYSTEIRIFRKAQNLLFNSKEYNKIFDLYSIWIRFERSFRLMENYQTDILTIENDVIDALGLKEFLGDSRVYDKNYNIVVDTIYWAEETEFKKYYGYLLLIDKNILIEYLKNRNFVLRLLINSEKIFTTNEDNKYSTEEKTIFINYDEPDYINRIANRADEIINTNKLTDIKEKWITFRIAELEYLNDIQGKTYLEKFLKGMVKKRKKEEIERSNLRYDIDDELLGKLLSRAGETDINED